MVTPGFEDEEFVVSLEGLRKRDLSVASVHWTEEFEVLKNISWNGQVYTETVDAYGLLYHSCTAGGAVYSGAVASYVFVQERLFMLNMPSP